MDSSSSFKLKDKLSVAPMLGITNNHFRSFVRLLSKEIKLYTEMINHDSILNSSSDLLFFPQDHKPISLQIGGNNPEKMGLAAQKAVSYLYDEININCGCPDSQVLEKKYGASLMCDPEGVSQCSKEVSKYFFTTLKCRTGLNEYKEDFLTNFIDITSTQGNVSKYIIHARLALMNLNTTQNRSIPPLQHEVAYELKETYPHLTFELNGGIKTLEEVKENNRKGLGCMIGRASYENVWMLKDADSVLYGKTYKPKSRKEVIYKYADYCNDIIQNNKENILFCDLIKPLTNLCNGEVQNQKYRQLLSSYQTKTIDNLPDFLYSVIDEYRKINEDAMEKET